MLPRVSELHDYQYFLTKYYIEHYRIQKYAPNSGYFLFMWIDFCPQSFYGVYDYWGQPKNLGIGGGLRALEESNHPIGIFMEHNRERPFAIHAVNDLLEDLGETVAFWSIMSMSGEEVTKGSVVVKLGPDSHVRVTALDFRPPEATAYRIVLSLRTPDGRELARNVYRNPFQPQPHPEGHPERVDHEIGMRLWWAGRP